MTEEKLLDELNDLIDCTLCPMDLMDSIDEYVRITTLEVLQQIKNGNITLEKTIDNLDYDKEFEELK
jgi:hypothetical protein|tara:strand:- start:74 stop:274 length:201 start_codon:yes stop_codon:yes gene_type:complete